MKPVFFASDQALKNISLKSQKRILILACEFYPQRVVGGLGRFVTGVSQGLANRGWEVAVFIPPASQTVYLPYWLPSGQIRAKRLAISALKWCQEHSWQPDWVWLQDWEGLFQRQTWQQKAKILWTIHSPLFLKDKNSAYSYHYSEKENEPVDWGDDFFEFASLIQHQVQQVDLVTTVSATYAREIEKGFLGDQKKRVWGIGNGLDLKEWQPSDSPFLKFKLKTSWPEFKLENKKILQMTFGLPSKEVPVFAFVSRLVPQKGIDLLIKALPQFLAKNTAQLVVVGQGLKRYHRFFLSLKKQFPTQVGLHLKANFSLPHQVFAGVDFLLLPSLAEPFGLVVAEARRYGAVPVVRGVGGLVDQVKDQLNGFSFANEKKEALLEKLHQAVNSWQTNWWWQTSFQNRKLITSWDQVAKKYENLLEANPDRPSPPGRIKEALFSDH